MPRHARRAPRPGAGDGRGCQPISCATRLDHFDAARIAPGRAGGTRAGRRLAFAASSSTKLSTAKQFATLPGARMFEGRSGAARASARAPSRLGRVGRIAVLRHQPDRLAHRLGMPAASGREQRDPFEVGGRAAAPTSRSSRRRCGRPASSVAAAARAAAAGPWGPSRARPRGSIARAPACRPPCDSSAASAAASSWPFMP